MRLAIRLTNKLAVHILPKCSLIRKGENDFGDELTFEKKRRRKTDYCEAQKTSMRKAKRKKNVKKVLSFSLASICIGNRRTIKLS